MAYTIPYQPGQKWVELGGGDNPSIRPNVDSRWLPAVDLVADLNHPIARLNGASFDGVYSSYAIEHMSWRTVRTLISESHRILKPGGIAVFITANLLEQMRVLVNAEEWNDDLISTIFGDQNYRDGQWDANAHHCGFSPKYATRLFNEAGFYKVLIVPIETGIGLTDMAIEAYKSRAIVRE